MLRALAFEQGITGKYSTAYRSVQEVRDSYRSREVSELQAMDAFIQPDLLVLDEIGVQYGTDSERLVLFNILNGRYEALKPTIVISNLNVDGVKKYLDDRVYDRLRENGGGVLAFDWEILMPFSLTAKRIIQKAEKKRYASSTRPCWAQKAMMSA